MNENEVQKEMSFYAHMRIAFRLIGIDCTSNADAMAICSVVDCVRAHDGNPTLKDMAEALDKAKQKAMKLEDDFYKSQKPTEGSKPDIQS